MQCIGPPVAMVCADIGAFRTNHNEGCGNVKVEPEDLAFRCTWIAAGLRPLKDHRRRQAH